MRPVHIIIINAIVFLNLLCPSVGFGGRYGVQKDRMDKSAVGHDFIGKTETHSSVTDAKKGQCLIGYWNLGKCVLFPVPTTSSLY